MKSLIVLILLSTFTIYEYPENCRERIVENLYTKEGELMARYEYSKNPSCDREVILLNRLAKDFEPKPPRAKQPKAKGD